jgi:hypothetical protein
VLVREELNVDATSLSIVSVEVDGAGPWPGNDARGPCRDLVVCGTGLGMPRSAALGDAIPTPESLGTTGPRATGLFLPGSISSPLPPIHWR